MEGEGGATPTSLSGFQADPIQTRIGHFFAWEAKRRKKNAPGGLRRDDCEASGVTWSPPGRDWRGVGTRHHLAPDQSACRVINRRAPIADTTRAEKPGRLDEVRVTTDEP